MMLERKKTPKHLVDMVEALRGGVKVLTDRLREVESRMRAMELDNSRRIEKLEAKVEGFIEGIGWTRREKVGSRDRE